MSDEASTKSEFLRTRDSAIGLRLIGLLCGAALVISLLAGWVIYSRMGHGVDKRAPLEVDMKALGNFRFSDATGTLADIPTEFRSLDGKMVALEGFMWAGNSVGDKTSSFQFVYNIQNSHGPPLVQERVFVTVPGKGTVDIIAREEVRIVGKLNVKITRDETGKVIQLYTMDLDHIECL